MGALEKAFHAKGITLTQRGRILDKVFSKISSDVVAVGIFDPENAKKAKYNEYGTSTIPARPFLTTALETNKREIAKKTRKLAMKSLLPFANVDAAEAELGEELAEMVKDSIRNGPWVPNAPSTIAKKGRNQPLIDTGEMLDSVTYKITTRS